MTKSQSLNQNVVDFYSCLTDRQLIVFCLFYGYNVRGITLGYTEISRLLKVKVESIYQTMEQITFKLSQKRFTPILEALKEYTIEE